MPWTVAVKVLVMAILTGLVGAAYPAWWAARLLPVEQLGRG